MRCLCPGRQTEASAEMRLDCGNSSAHSGSARNGPSTFPIVTTNCITTGVLCAAFSWLHGTRGSTSVAHGFVSRARRHLARHLERVACQCCFQPCYRNSCFLQIPCQRRQPERFRGECSPYVPLSSRPDFWRHLQLRTKVQCSRWPYRQSMPSNQARLRRTPCG